MAICLTEISKSHFSLGGPKKINHRCKRSFQQQNIKDISQYGDSWVFLVQMKNISFVIHGQIFPFSDYEFTKIPTNV